jgi:hypothetical protein
VSQVVNAAERAMTYGLFDVTRLEKMLLQEYGARLFAFRRGDSSGGSGAVTPAAAVSKPNAAPPRDNVSIENEDPAENKTDGGDE